MSGGDCRDLEKFGRFCGDFGEVREVRGSFGTWVRLYRGFCEILAGSRNDFHKQNPAAPSENQYPSERTICFQQSTNPPSKSLGRYFRG